jgi:hypothetical protein
MQPGSKYLGRSSGCSSTGCYGPPWSAKELSSRSILPFPRYLFRRIYKLACRWWYREQARNRRESKNVDSEFQYEAPFAEQLMKFFLSLRAFL